MQFEEKTKLNLAILFQENIMCSKHDSCMCLYQILTNVIVYKTFSVCHSCFHCMGLCIHCTRLCVHNFLCEWSHILGLLMKNALLAIEFNSPLASYMTVCTILADGLRLIVYYQIHYLWEMGFRLCIQT